MPVAGMGDSAPGSPGAGSAPAAPGATSATSPYYAPPSGADASAVDYAGATDAYQKALVRFNQQRTGLLQQYGYKGTVDPTTGMVGNISVDPGDTYGQLQALLHSQANEDTSAQNATEDRGIFGGLANQAESELHYEHGAASSALANTLLSNLDNVNGQQLDAKNTLDQALWQMAQTPADTAIANGDYNPAAPPDSSATTGGGTTANTSRARTIPMAAATKLVTAATNAGQPTSEHGLGSQGNSKAAQVAKKVIANAYTSGKKKTG